MNQAFPAPYIYPIDRASQNKALQQARWGGMATYGAVPNNSLQGLSSYRQTGGRGTINNYGVPSPTPTTPPIPYSSRPYSIQATNTVAPTMFSQPMAAINSLLPAPETPVGMLGSPQVNMSYMPSSSGFNLPNYIREVGPSGLPVKGLDSGKSLFGDMLDKGKKTWEENKWLVGDKENIGPAQLGLGLFDAFNQYTLGKERIRSMREQNRLAGESFAFNKEGLKTELEDKLLKRNLNQNYYINGDKMSYADNLASAKTKTEEEMKRFK